MCQREAQTSREYSCSELYRSDLFHRNTKTLAYRILEPDVEDIVPVHGTYHRPSCDQAVSVFYQLAR